MLLGDENSNNGESIVVNPDCNSSCISDSYLRTLEAPAYTGIPVYEGDGLGCGVTDGFSCGNFRKKLPE